jgi:hypothetical protein
MSIKYNTCVVHQTPEYFDDVRIRVLVLLTFSFLIQYMHIGFDLQTTVGTVLTV